MSKILLYYPPANVPHPFGDADEGFQEIIVAGQGANPVFRGRQSRSVLVYAVKRFGAQSGFFSNVSEVWHIVSAGGGVYLYTGRLGNSLYPENNFSLAAGEDASGDW